MKKLILSLLILCSTMIYSQGTIPIPQVIGLPAALASKVDKVTGKSLVSDTSIVKLTGVQAGAQVNKLEGIQKNGVDLTISGKKVNITVPTTAAEIGAQPAGTYATGTGTAYNSNNGDETLTSIKTKLGAATSVSDGYLKYQDFADFAGKLSSEVDGSVTNELQTISTTGAAGNITLSNSGGTLNLNVNDADASTTNEIQDLSLSGNTLTLSSDATTVDISQATAVLANTAKVSNATHTGDVTGSTALTLATVNSNIGTFNNVTINAKGQATAGSNVSYLTGITSGQVTTALGYTPKPTFTENTGFNKPFGTTPETVLEGRTFGTAAGSAVGDFIQNQNASSQAANMWINGNGTFSGNLYCNSATKGLYLSRSGVGDRSAIVSNTYGQIVIGDSNDWLSILVNRPTTFSSMINAEQLQSTISTGTSPITVNSSTLVSNLNADLLDGNHSSAFAPSSTISNATHTGDATGSTALTLATVNSNVGTYNNVTINAKGLATAGSNVSYEPAITGLTAGFVPARSGSSFSNSNIENDENGVILTTNKDLYFGLRSGDGIGGYFNGTSLIWYNGTGGAPLMSINRTTKDISISSTTTSTSPSTGALVVGGGIGVGGAAVVGGKIRVTDATESDLSGSTPVDGSITTLGGITAAKNIQTGGDFFSNGSMISHADISANTGIYSGANITANGNIYSNGIELLTPIYQAQTVVNGSTGGDIMGTMPIRTGTYKEALIYARNLSGSATYTFPVAFINAPTATYVGGSGANVSTTVNSISFSSGVNANMFIKIEGY